MRCSLSDSRKSLTSPTSNIIHCSIGDRSKLTYYPRLQIHNYVHRISPHLLNYPRYVHDKPAQQQLAQAAAAQNIPPPPPPTEPTPLDEALRTLIARLQPYGLTKGEVLMIINLGVGLSSSSSAAAPPEGEGAQGQEEGQDVEMANGEPGATEGEGGEGGEAAIADEDYGVLALLDTVIEEREERLSNEDVAQILAIIRETLGPKKGGRTKRDEVGVDGGEG